MNIVERRRRGLGSSASRTFRLTLIGAKNDVITIKDSGGHTVGTCTFPSGATQGTIDVSGNPSELYTFTSSIAKDTTSGTSAYSKQMYLSDDAMKVMPNGALYWYGNECTDITGGWDSVYFYGGSSTYFTLTKETNGLKTKSVRSISSGVHKAGFATHNKINIGNIIKVVGISYNPGSSQTYYADILSTLNDTLNGSGLSGDSSHVNITTAESGQIKTMEKTGTNPLYLAVHHYLGYSNATEYTILNAMWEE